MFATIMDRETSSQGGSLWYPSHVMIYILDYWIAMSIYNPFLRPDLIQKIYACVVSTCDKWSYHRLKNLTMNYLPPSVQWSTKRLQKPTMNNLPSVSEWSTKDFRISYTFLPTFQHYSMNPLQMESIQLNELLLINWNICKVKFNYTYYY